MNRKLYSVKDLIMLFRQELKTLYDEKESFQLLYLLFNSWKGWSKARLLMENDHTLPQEEIKKFLDALTELKQSKPIQYITGETFFRGLKLKVSPDVLIPRPETEELIEYAISEFNQIEKGNLSFLDIGTGSGSIAISLKTKFPNTRVSAVDISLKALNIARENAKLNNCEIEFFQSDILNYQSWSDFSEYHLIIANPPYVTESEKQFMEPNVLNYEPSVALFVPDDDPLLYYRAIADFAMTHLIRPGRIFLEINENADSGIRDLLSSKGFLDIKILPDMQQKSRFATAKH